MTPWIGAGFWGAVLGALGSCVVGWAMGLQAPWGRAILWLSALGWLFGALSSLSEPDPERQIDRLCALHFCWAVLGAAVYAQLPAGEMIEVRGALIAQVGTHAVLVPGLARWMERRRGVRRRGEGRRGTWALVVLCALGALFGAIPLVAAAWLDPAVARLAAVGLALTLGVYGRILGHGPGHVTR